MGERICSIEGCDSRARKRGWCGKHYQRWLKHGDVSVVRKGGTPKRRDPVCSAEGCSKPHFARGWCHMHYNRWSRHGDIDIVLCVLDAEVPTYSALHSRLRASVGSAADFACCRCGGAAAAWAYDHSDPDPLFSDRGLPYSLDFSRYQPMCVPCHNAFDLEHKCGG